MSERRITRIYVSYPYSDNPKKRIKEVRKIVRQMMSKRNGFVLFIPHFAFHAFNKDYGVEIADEHCLELLKVSDVLCVCLPKGSPTSRGMKIEFEYAKAHGMPVMYLSDFLKNPSEVLKGKRNLEEAISSR
jgi:hypothetical protein